MSTEESSPSGKVMRKNIKKEAVELGQPSLVIKGLENTYVRKINRTKASELQTPVMVESPGVLEHSSSNKA